MGLTPADDGSERAQTTGEEEQQQKQPITETLKGIRSGLIPDLFQRTEQTEFPRSGYNH